jgi:hypothetical protein
VSTPAARDAVVGGGPSDERTFRHIPFGGDVHAERPLWRASSSTLGADWLVRPVIVAV